MKRYRVVQFTAMKNFVDEMESKHEPHLVRIVRDIPRVATQRRESFRSRAVLTSRLLTLIIRIVLIRHWLVHQHQQQHQRAVRERVIDRLLGEEERVEAKGQHEELPERARETSKHACEWLGQA